MELQVNVSSKTKCIPPFLYLFEGKRTEYKSCPYHSIKAFSVETAGSLDADVELKVYGSGLDISIDFDKKKINVFDIQKYLSHHVFADSMEEILAYNEPAPMVMKEIPLLTFQIF